MDQQPPKQKSKKDGKKYLSDAQIDLFIKTFNRAQKHAPMSVLPDVTFEDLPVSAQKDIIELEEKFVKELDEIHEKSAEEQLGLVRKSIKGVLSFFDLETKEKAMEALIEIVPYVGAVYAVTGRKIEIEEGKPKLGKLTWTERGLYLAGELLLSGHLLVGIRRSLVKQGLRLAMKEAAKVGAKRTGLVLVRRSQEKLLEKEQGTV